MESRCWTPSSSGFSPTHQRYWSYLDLLVENDWLLSQQGGTFLCQSATNHTSLRIAWEHQAGLGRNRYHGCLSARYAASFARWGNRYHGLGEVGSRQDALQATLA